MCHLTVVGCRSETGILKCVKGTAPAKEKGTPVMVFDTCIAKPVLESSLQAPNRTGLAYVASALVTSCCQFEGVHIPAFRH